MNQPILRIAIPSPLRRLFDYLPPSNLDSPTPGQRFLVPFGRTRTVGILLEVASHSELPREKLKPALRQLDRAPLLDAAMMQLLRWACDYYHHPPGEVFQTALPVLLRQERAAEQRGVAYWQLTSAGMAIDPDTLSRAPRQQALLKLLRDAAPPGLSAEIIDRQQQQWQGVMRTLVEKGWVERNEVVPAAASRGCADETPPTLNASQQQAVTHINNASGFQAMLLDGVTGSGKTEVYLQAIAHTLAQGRQALVLIPEIGLTPQLLERVAGHFGRRPAVLHSGLADGTRQAAWRAACEGDADVVVGTRSAVFVPLARPGVIVVDEEHDPSFKQQDGFRYHARDVAVVRAREAGIPVVLGSATPSLESLRNAGLGRYRTLRLPARAGDAAVPVVDLVDLRGRKLSAGISPQLLQALDEELDAGRQALVFLNRRGFATTLICHDCGWIAGCRRCDARMTLHLARERLCCHHCGSERRPDSRCPDCGGEDLRPLGQGTERLEAVLAERYAAAGVVRIDRDTTRRRGSLDAKLAAVHGGQARLLVGTQMLAKGHHFPEVTLVGVVNADAGLFGTDFRAAERVAQQIVQVVGRAGRAQHPGRVLVQTHHPEHPLLQALVHSGYHAFAEAALQERRQAGLPPWTHLALLRAEAVDVSAPDDFLERARMLLPSGAGVDAYGPVPAPMARRGGRQRAQLLLQAPRREPLQRLLDTWIEAVERLPAARRVRWSLDVDPIELF